MPIPNPWMRCLVVPLYMLRPTTTPEHVVGSVFHTSLIVYTHTSTVREDHRFGFILLYCVFFFCLYPLLPAIYLILFFSDDPSPHGTLT